GLCRCRCVPCESCHRALNLVKWVKWEQERNPMSEMSEMSGTVTEWLKPNQPLALWWQQYYPGLHQVSRDLAVRISAARTTAQDSSPHALTLPSTPGIPVDAAGLRYYDYGLLGGAIDYRMRMEFTRQWG